jgi:hypothetical protein
MRRKESGHRRLVGLVALCGLLAVALEVTVATAAGRDDSAQVAKARKGKIIASPRFDVPEQMLAPPRPAGSPTVSFAITGKLAMRCFTSASSNGRKVKCPGAVLKVCVAGRTIEVIANFSEIPRQSVSARADGSFTVTVVFQDDFQEGFLKLAPVRTQSKGLKISCYPDSSPFDISEAPAA